MYRDAERFVSSSWCKQAEGLGWTALDIFGAHRPRPGPVGTVPAWYSASASGASSL